MRKLVVAEKPSVAQSLARVIGATKRQDGYLEGNGYLVSWCVGHLVELSAPERYDERFAKWRLEDLPILPALIASVADKFGYTGEALRAEPVRPSSVFDSSKVSDHHAIIPTKTMAGSDTTGLSSGEKAVLQLISARLLCAVAEDHR